MGGGGQGTAPNGSGNNTSSRPIRPFRRSPYAVLNLPENSRRQIHVRQDRRANARVGQSTVSEEEIRDAYKRLSRIFHPDKRPPGKEREDAQEMFLELTNAYGILGDPALRQAYDHFGHSVVARVRHNKYGPNSLYRHLSKLHDKGKSVEALELLQAVIEDSKREQRQEEWQFHADMNIEMHTCDPEVNDYGKVLRLEWPEVSATDVSLTAIVPIPPPTNESSHSSDSYGNTQRQRTEKKQQMQLSIGGQSNLENGLGSTCGVLSASYHPVPHTEVSSELTIGRKHAETSLSSTKQLTNGTTVIAKMTRIHDVGHGKGGKMSFMFMSQRPLTVFKDRTVHATFALGMDSNLQLHYSQLSLTTLGFYSNNEYDSDEDEDEEEDDDFDDKSHDESETHEERTSKSVTEKSKKTSPPPRITAKLSIGQYPVEVSIMQSHLFQCPLRSGEFSLSWSPLRGYQLKGLLSRKISTRWIHGHTHDSGSDVCSNLGIGVEHTGMHGLTWVIQYHRPEGVSLRIPIFISSFLAPFYWNTVTLVSLFTLLIDESVGEMMGHSSIDSADENLNRVRCQKIAQKIRKCNNEQVWMCSSYAKQDAERQLSIIEPIAKLKRHREESIDGLVILNATYTAVSLPPASFGISASLNVTQQLQFWVENSSLSLPQSSKSLLLGFYDLCKPNMQKHRRYLTESKTPEGNYGALQRLTDKALFWLYRLLLPDADCPNSLLLAEVDNSNSKENFGGRTEGDFSVTLTVRYRYQGQVFEVSVDDEEPLELPNDDAFILGASNVVS